MSAYLLAVNLAAFVGAAIALVRYRLVKADRDDTGRALMVALTALLVLALGGFARRVDLDDADLAVAAAWTAAATAAWWAATHRPPQ